MSHIVLSLDLGSNMGWCLIKDNQILYSGVAHHKPKLETKKGTKFRDFQLWIEEFGNLDEIWYEEVLFVTSRNQMLIWAGYLAILQIYGVTANIPVVGVSPGAWKKAFTGNGAAKKPEICNKAIELGWKNGEYNTEKNNDEADAIGIAFAMMASRDKELEFARHNT